MYTISANLKGPLILRLILLIYAPQEKMLPIKLLHTIDCKKYFNFRIV